MIETPNCPVCHSGTTVLFEREVAYPGDDLEGHLLDSNYVRNNILFDRIFKRREPRVFRFRRCNRCALVYFSPRPEDCDMAVKYEAINQYHDTKLREANLARRYDRPAHTALRSRGIRERVERVRPIRNDKILDVGGAEGHNLHSFVPDNECFVIDYEHCKLVAGVKYLCQMVDEAPAGTEAGLALMCHIVEHLTDPVRDLKRVRGLLRPGGLFYVEVPHGYDREPARLGNFLTHINFFSVPSLDYLLRYSGFKVRCIQARPTLASVGYSYTIVAVAERPEQGDTPPEAATVPRPFPFEDNVLKHYFFRILGRARHHLICRRLRK